MAYGFKIAFFGVIAAALSVWSTIVGATEVLVGLNHAPPYRIVEQTDSKTLFRGYYIDVFEEAARRAGLKPVYHEMPFKRALDSMDSGTIDMMLGPNRTAEREAYIHYVEIALPAEVKAVFIQMDEKDISSLDMLSEKVVGTLSGASYNRDLEDNNVRLHKGKDNRALLKMLDAGRLDAVIAPSLQASYHIRDLGIEVKRASFNLPGKKSFFAFSRKSGVLSSEKYEKFEAAMKDMAEDGTITRFRQFYENIGAQSPDRTVHTQ